MWFMIAAGTFLWLYFDRGIGGPVTSWLHQPVLGSHAADVHGYWLAGVVIAVLVLCSSATRKTGEVIPGAPRDHGWVMALALAFCGFLWYLVQIHAKPAQNVTVNRPQPTVTVTAPVQHAVSHGLVNWETVALFGVVGVVALAVLYLVVRFIL